MNKILKQVTVTGADDYTPIPEIIEVAQKYPFVEFGILMSTSQAWNARFPSIEWIQHFTGRARGAGVKAAGHLCGQMVREFLSGEPIPTLLKFMKALAQSGVFKRWQINTHGVKHKFGDGLLTILDDFGSMGQEFIIQNDDANNDLIQFLLDHKVKNISTLFDLSHGAGVLPQEWPKPLEGIKCGYAGGLSPENVAAQLEKIEQISGETWIDAETWLRGTGGVYMNMSVFKIPTVERFLENAKPWVI